jgi:hypothetical protein
MKTIFVILTAILASGSIASCERSSIKKANTPITEKQKDFNSEGNSFGIYNCPYTDKELVNVLSNRNKAAWPKIKVTATFGGFNITHNNPCVGCQNCGCCIGLCVEVSRNSVLAHNPLTDEEINHQVMLFDFIDNPGKKEIILIPNSNADNGDGYFHIENNATFSNEVNDHIGREIRMKQGSYQIKQTSSYAHGIIVVKTL